ncbi:MAG: universal stress protein [Haloferacaceae archaeon]
MYRVVVPVGDDVDRGRAQAEFVAGLPDAAEAVEATVTHALHGDERDAPAAMRRPDRVEAVSRASDRLREAGVAVTVTEISPPPAEGIVALADRVDADLVVMSSRKPGPAGEVLFGSVTESVLSNADRPVAVTGDSGE